MLGRPGGTGGACLAHHRPPAAGSVRSGACLVRIGQVEGLSLDVIQPNHGRVANLQCWPRNNGMRQREGREQLFKVHVPLRTHVQPPPPRPTLVCIPAPSAWWYVFSAAWIA